MSGWCRESISGLPLYQARAMAGLPGIVQGFTTRIGGVSCPPYDALNLGSHVADQPEHVHENRQRVWATLGFTEQQAVLAEQVHGPEIAVVTAGSASKPVPGVDALITQVPDLLLMLFFADCVPIYLVDPVHKAIGLAHAGWRGAAANIAGKTVAKMTAEFETRPASCLAAIGPCIGGDSYEIGPEVADRFHTVIGALSGEKAGKFFLDLRHVVCGQLLEAGIPAESISVCVEDTYCNREEFFSFRREGVTGRMAAVLALRGNKVR